MVEELHIGVEIISEARNEAGLLAYVDFICRFRYLSIFSQEMKPNYYKIRRRRRRRNRRRRKEEGEGEGGRRRKKKEKEEVWLIALMMSFHNPHKKYERKLKACIETRTPYMLYKVCSSNTMPFQWSSFCPKSKCKHYFHNHLKPAKLTWTTMYWKKHKN
ncbi:hypothetical protein ZWY2020_019722, partial [Hordeum vulgare]